MKKLENDPKLHMPKKILDHHPHHEMPPHGKVRARAPYMKSMISKPPRGKHD